MTDAATPGEEAKKPTDPATPAGQSGVETVTLSKAEHEQLTRDAARAASAQSKLDRLTKARERGGQHFGAAAPATPPPTPTKEEAEARGVEEDRKASTGILRLATEPKYRELLDADPTLRNLMTSNPLAVLPLLASEAFDAEDAISLISEELDKRLSSLKKPTPSGEPKPSGNSPTPSAPPSGGVNAADKAIDEEYEAAKKNPNTEQAISSMIKTGLKKMGQKGKT